MKSSETEKKELIDSFAHKSPCMCFNLRKASRAITQVYDELFKEVGLRVSQISILNSLDMIGSLSVSQLSEAMATDRTTITRNLKPLERDGYVRIQAGQDRRSKVISVTAKGKEAASHCQKQWYGFQEKMYKTIGEERLTNLCNELASTLEEIQNLQS